MRGFYVRADFATIARIDATVAYLARALLAMGDTSNLDVRRTKAVLIMANPTQAVKILQAYAKWQRQPVPTETTDADSATDTQAPALTPERFDPAVAAELLDEAKLLPTVWLFAHLAGSSVGRVEGSDPVTTDWVRKHLGARCRFKLTPVLDPLDQVPVDAYEIPDRHRQAVHLLTPADTFPFASNTTRAMQIDHTVAWTQERAARRREAVPHRELRTHGRPAPPDQDPRQMAGQTTLPRCLPVARPLRRHLPRRPHRHPPTTNLTPLAALAAGGTAR